MPLPLAGERAVLYLDEDLGPADGDPAPSGRSPTARVACAPGELLYARVDLLGEVVLELEVAEPSLYLEFGEGAATRLAAAIRRRPWPERRFVLISGPKGVRYAGRVSTTDTLGRPLRDLRVSVTDRCNFRCVYCMPKEVFGRDYRFLERRELLTFEEIERLARAFVAHGVEKIRITGGEPLVRRDLERLIERLAAIPGLDLTLTTNGALLPEKAKVARRRRAPPGDGQPRLAPRRGLCGDERRRLPGRSACSRESTRPQPPDCR